MPKSTPVTKPVVLPPVPQVKVVSYLDKNIKISPRKLRLLANDVKKFTPSEAVSRLKFTNSLPARTLIKAIKTITADAKNNFNLDTNTLKFDTIRVDESLKIKRVDKAHGSRFARGTIQKRHSRLVITITGQSLT